jgi:Kef-type K+ transport system membrane component KefB
LQNDFQSILLISSIAVLAPLLSRAPGLANVPVVAIELAMGVLVGPSVAGLVTSDGIIDFLSRLGLAFLFFRAGFEFRLKSVGADALRLGVIAWSASLALAAVAVTLLYLVDFVSAPVLIAIALSTTAFGILLPVLRQTMAVGDDLKRYVLGAAAVGEIGPLLLASVALAKDHRLDQIFVTLVFLALSVGCIFLVARFRSEQTSSLILRRLADDEILPVRASLVLLLGFVFLANRFGIEIVIGAYAAGLAVAMLVDGTEAEVLEERLTLIGSGFFVPVFFIASGAELDLSTLVSSPGSLARLAVFCLLFMVIRAAPLQLFRGALDKRDMPALALLTSVTLPLVVAIAYLGVRKGQMSTEDASALVGAAVITVTGFPTLALSICADKQKSRPPGRVETFVMRCSEWGMKQFEGVFGAVRRK